MPHQRLKPENFLDEERLVALKNIIPEAFADNKINWSTLKDALGGELEDKEKPDEHFGLFWPGKRKARKLASRPSKGTLIPVKGEGIKEETTQNIFIEGENLEVLKILRKSLMMMKILFFFSSFLLLSKYEYPGSLVTIIPIGACSAGMINTG